MKKYQSPGLERVSLETEDVITASAITNGIVSAVDSEGADGIRESSWNDSWN